MRKLQVHTSSYEALLSMDPPQLEPVIATKTGSGQYSGCPEISTEFSARVTAV